MAAQCGRLQKWPQLSIPPRVCHIAVTLQRGLCGSFHQEWNLFSHPLAFGVSLNQKNVGKGQWASSKRRPQEARHGSAHSSGTLTSPRAQGPVGLMKNERSGRAESSCSSCSPGMWQSAAKISKATSPTCSWPQTQEWAQARPEPPPADHRLVSSRE